MDAEGGTVGPVDDAPWIEALTFHPISPFNIDWLINSFEVFFQQGYIPACDGNGDTFWPGD